MLLYVDNQDITDIRVNLAIEEFILKNLDVEEHTYLLFYINEPSIIVGKNQNTIEEINSKYVAEHDIIVTRRLSGGGAVYDDLGNMSFGFVTKDDGNSFNNFKKFTKPVTDALQELGVNAELSGRNDILVEGRKISGNAQFATRGRMFSHGTLLFDTNVDSVVAALNVKKDKIESKGIKSVRSRVANIIDFLPKKISIYEFKEILLKTIFHTDDVGNVPQYHLTEEDWKQIHQIAEERYKNWTWVYGKSPKFNIQHAHRFPVGQIDIRLEINKGMIEHCKIFGDFFGAHDVSDIEERLVGIRYEKSEIEKVLASMDVQDYFGKMAKEEFLDLIY